jgi:ABC-2 type transport system ATP-binding protein
VNVIETHDLGRRYGSTWALRECSLSIPAGHLSGLVGPNGAGKTTLLNLVMGLSTPSAGDLTVLGDLRPGSLPALDAIGFVAQDVPVYRGFSVDDMVTLTRNLNRSFDVAHARRRLADLGIGLRKRAGQLSGGQRAQLALTLALARHPRLLVLDEPTASLDPLARHDFMATVMAAMAEDGVSVVLSSHLLAELERVADHVVLMSGGRVCLDGPVEDLLAGHRLVTTRTGPATFDPGWEVVESSTAGAQTHQLVRLRSPGSGLPAGCDARPVGIEELAMAYLRTSTRVAAPILEGAHR